MNWPAHLDTEVHVQYRTCLFTTSQRSYCSLGLLELHYHKNYCILSHVYMYILYLGKKSGVNVVQVFPEDGNMGRVLPKYLTEWTTSKVRKG